jgi:hypothetical protein
MILLDLIQDLNLFKNPKQQNESKRTEQRATVVSPGRPKSKSKSFQGSRPSSQAIGEDR